MHVENVLVLVVGIGKNVAPVRLARALVKVIILFHNLLQLGLDFGNFALGKVKLLDGHLGIPKVLQKLKFLGHEEKQSLAFSISTTRRAAHPVYVLLWIIWGVVLYDPVHGRYVKTPGSHICAQ